MNITHELSLKWTPAQQFLFQDFLVEPSTKTNLNVAKFRIQYRRDALNAGVSFCNLGSTRCNSTKFVRVVTYGLGDLLRLSLPGREGKDTTPKTELSWLKSGLILHAVTEL